MFHLCLAESSTSYAVSFWICDMRVLVVFWGMLSNISCYNVMNVIEWLVAAWFGKHQEEERGGEGKLS